MFKYTLDIYPPNGAGKDFFLNRIQSETPFLTIQRGDLISPHQWSKFGRNNFKSEFKDYEYDVVLRVIGIEHFIIEESEDNEPIANHRICIYTEAVEDTEEARYK